MPWPAATEPERSRTMSSGNGQSRARGRARDTRTKEPNMRADRSAAPRAPPVRGSGRSRTRAVREESGIGPAPVGRGGRAASTPTGSVGGEGQERDVARPLDGQRELALVLRARAEHAPGQDLAALG